MSNTVTELQALVRRHPTIGLDLNDVLAAMENEDRLDRHEVEAIQDAAQEGWASFRAAAPASAHSAQRAAQPGLSEAQTPWQIQAKLLPDGGRAHMRAEVSRAHKAAKRQGAGYRMTLERLGVRDPHGAAAVRQYVSALRAEAAAARVYARALAGEVEL